MRFGFTKCREIPIIGLMRKRLYEISEKATRHDVPSRIYDYLIIAAALLSMLPLIFKKEPTWMPTLELYAVYILFMDFLFHWITTDYMHGVEDAPLKIRVRMFLIYPFRPMVFLNFLSLLPTLGILGQGFLVLRLFRLTTLSHYSKSLRYIGRVFSKEKKTLLAVLYIALIYIFVSALIMFTFEPDSFDDYFEALYWATTALTTVGYGDVAPVTWVGRLISMLSSLFGIAVIALPAGIVTAGFVEEIKADTAQEATDDIEDAADAAARDRIESQNLEDIARAVPSQEKALNPEDAAGAVPSQEEALRAADIQAKLSITGKTEELKAAAEEAQSALFENIDGAVIDSVAAQEARFADEEEEIAGSGADDYE